MNRIKWPKDPEAKDRALRAACSLGSSPEWRTICEYLIPFNLEQYNQELRERNPDDFELARVQGITQLLQSLLTLSTDADAVRRAKPQTPTVRPR